MADENVNAPEVVEEKKSWWQSVREYTQTTAFKNWKSTAMGCIASAYLFIEPLLQNGVLTKKDILYACFALAAGLIAGDGNVTKYLIGSKKK